MKSRKPAQRVSLAVAYTCYAAAVSTLLASGYWAAAEGTENPIFASLVASVVFLVGSGIVLHVMGAANLPDLSISATDKSDKRGP